jgi:hypothetical protein
MRSVECKNCGRSALKSISRYNESLKNGWNFFCSRTCRYGYQEKGRETQCAHCQKPVRKTPAEIRKTKRHVFCSKSCAASFNNRHKEHGCRRSRLERYIEQRLNQEFGDLVFTCNGLDIIGAELDFYFPELNLAVEVNGIMHYKPIYGLAKLKQIQDSDQHKAMFCRKQKIKLKIIDVSREVSYTKSMREKYWKVVKKLVASRLKRAGHTNVQVP